jgi:glutamate-1-semialdehyde 2,1-aminomutase
MAGDGWWWHDERLTNQAIRRGLLREMLSHRF